MYDYLFKHGQQLVTDDNLRRSAASLGLNVARFDREFLDRTYSRHVDEDIQSGKSSGINSTPTLSMKIDMTALGIWIVCLMHLTKKVCLPGDKQKQIVQFRPRYLVLI
jgi:predicted DsbA family dithiol-disulfide isomerase